MGYTTSDIITSIKKRGVIPTAQKTFETDDLIRFMDEELRTEIVPMLMSVRADYFLEKLDTTLVSGADSYELPPRAIGMKIKNVFYLDAGGNPNELVQVEIDNLPRLQGTQTGHPEYFYFKDNYLVVLPTPDSSETGSLRTWYYLRRNELISPNAAGKITAIDTGTGVVTVNATPSPFSTTATYDFVKGSPGFQNLSMDVTCSATGASTVTFLAADLPATLAVNDYVCLAGESPIPQVFLEVFPVLSQRVVVRALRGINDIAGSEKAIEDLKKLDESLIKLISTRADEQSKKIVSDNSLSRWVWGRNTKWW